MNQYQKKYYEKNKERMILQMKESHKKMRKVCLSHYSSEEPFCACCGEKTFQFLGLDHIDGGGSKHRQNLLGSGKRGGNIYWWCIKNDFPSIFQVLCHNCNLAKGFYGMCPHRNKVTKDI